jgi:hypothetical protein
MSIETCDSIALTVVLLPIWITGTMFLLLQAPHHNPVSREGRSNSRYGPPLPRIRTHSTTLFLVVRHAPLSTPSKGYQMQMPMFRYQLRV